MLYIRMFITMGISLFTSRIILKTLGVEDFGIYNIVGGIVVLFSFLSTAMAISTQRFISFELGRKDYDEVKRVFSMSMTLHISVVLLIFVLAESIGLWLLNSKLNIPPERMSTAKLVYQISILTFCINVIRVPYNASIIAYEKMTFYAYVGIAEAVMKLMFVFLMVYIPWDKLILFAVMICGLTLITLILYIIYCTRVLKTCNYKFFWDGSLYKKLLSFSGWSLLGNIANVGAQQGLNILLNIFWGVTVNAAMGVANQVSTAIYSFVSNFQTAFSPQIVKSYSGNDHEYFMSLITRASKFSYYLLFFLALPILICTDTILDIWLDTVPEHSVSFCRLIIIYMLIDAISAPLWMSVQATGKIRNYQILMGSLILLNVPLAYIILKLGYSPESVIILRVIINLITYLTRIFYLKPLIGLSIRKYISEVIWVTLYVTLLSLPFPLIAKHYISNLSGLIVTIITALITGGLSIYIFGLKKNEKAFIHSLVLDKIKLWK